MRTLGYRTMAENKSEFQRETIPDAHDRIVTVLSRYILDGDLPELRLDEGAPCRERAGNFINRIGDIVKGDRIASSVDLEECILIVGNIRAVQGDLGTDFAYYEAQSLVRDLYRYRNWQCDGTPIPWLSL